MRATTAFVLLAMVSACGEVGVDGESDDGDGDGVPDASLGVEVDASPEVDPDASPDPGVAVDLIDDLEDGNDTILENGGRRGHWFVINVGTGGTQTFTVTAGGANGSEYSANTTGEGFTKDSWAKMSLFLHHEDRNPGVAPIPIEANYDASGYTGIQFRARGERVRVAVRTRNPMEIEDGGECAPDPMLGPCNNYHGKDLSLSSEWTEYRVSFGDMKPGDWGQEFPLNLMEVIAIEFELNEQPQFELSVDNVAFYTAVEDAP